MKYRILVFALVVFATLAVGLGVGYPYHFFFVEQSQLFLFSWDYFAAVVSHVGGLAEWLGEFFVQFFVLPWAGALITAGLLALTGVLTALLCRRLAPQAPLYVLWALPVVALLCVQLDSNYFYSGTVAFLITLTALLLCTRLSLPGNRFVVAMIAVPLLFWLCGPVAMLFAVCVVVWEAAVGTPRWYLVSFVPVWAFGLAWGLVDLSFVGDWFVALSPRAYFAPRIEPGPEIWFAWISVPVTIALTRLCRGLRTGSAPRETILTAVQVVAVALLAWAVVTYYVDREYYKLKRLDHLARTAQWDTIVALSRGSLDNYVYLNYLNLALSHKGVLADDMFRYSQHGPYGLAIDWDLAQPSAIVLGEINFAIGNVAIAREMAFEGWTASAGYGNPTMLRRLVETNLIYGSWAVAEKYLNVLSQTLFYRDWTEQHRRFLGDDAAVEADPLLGDKRRNLPAQNRLSLPGRHIENLLAIIRQNPSNRTAVEYLGAFTLLARDMGAFAAVLDEFYGTEALPFLPRSFAEAVFILYEQEPEAWARYGIGREMVDRYEAFRSQVLSGRRTTTYRDTYWSYYISE